MGSVPPLSGNGSESFAQDISRAESECRLFSEQYRGRLGELARTGSLGEVVERHEQLEDLLGRLMSYAGLVYSGDTTDPIRAKFYGDTQERLTPRRASFCSSRSS
jgi:oligoendopeptidase F